MNDVPNILASSSSSTMVGDFGVRACESTAEPLRPDNGTLFPFVVVVDALVAVDG